MHPGFLHLFSNLTQYACVALGAGTSPKER